MTDQFNQSSSNSIGPDPQESTLPAQTPTLTNRQMFALGTAAGGLLSFTGIALSMEMTQTAITDLRPVAIGIAVIVPFVFGILSFKFKEPFLDVLSAMMNSLPY